MGDIEEAVARIRELERKVDLLMRHLGLDAGSPAGSSGGVPDDVARLVREGRKIDAIKRYREITGLGLKEAKDAVDAIGDGRLR